MTSETDITQLEENLDRYRQTITTRLRGVYEFSHFSSSVDANGLKFDYQLQPGIATSRNAIALLEFLGYPKEITG